MNIFYLVDEEALQFYREAKELPKDEMKR